MKETSLCAYSAPVCITLAGGKHPFEPALMCAYPLRVHVSVTPASSTKPIVDELNKIAVCVATMHPDDPVFEGTWNVRVPEGIPHDHHGVISGMIVAYCACYLHLKNNKEPAPGALQKLAYQVEKKLLKLASHAQTTTSAVGGLVFYRKEFEFHKTVFTIPAHVPRSFLENVSDAPGANIPLDMYIRRIIFAVMHEDEKMFHGTYDQHRGDLPKTLSLQEDREGVRRED